MTQPIAFFDIAGTLVDGNPWTFFFKHPAISRIRLRLAMARVLPVYVGKKLKLNDDVLFRHQWVSTMAWLVKDWSRDKLQSVFDWVVNDQMESLLRQDVLQQLQQHKTDGYRVVLVSGMFDVLVQSFVQRVGADAGIGSVLDFQQDTCTGKIRGETAMGPRKLDFMRRYLVENNFSGDLKACYGYADSYSDVPLLDAVGHSIATYPDAGLRAVAEARGWTILGA